ncbi:MAG: excinuclease ABC subunit C [Gammaproteobacteria bacterium]|nr:excinuclease ABC subunit C [Gammaproteobacteria bacterium]
MNTDINHILVNGAQIAFSKLKRAQSFNARLYYYAEIGVYLEVSLSHGAGITDDTHDQIKTIYNQATRFHMGQNKRASMAK